MKTPYPLSGSPRYRNFIKDRDQVLERIHEKTQSIQTDVTRAALARALEAIAFRYGQISMGDGFSVRRKNIMRQMEDSIDHAFQQAAAIIVQRAIRARRWTYLLSYRGEAEAMGRATGKTQTVTLNHAQLDDVAGTDGISGVAISSRINYLFSNLKRDILKAVELSLTLSSKTEDMVKRVAKAFPKKITPKVYGTLKRPSLREAAGDEHEVPEFTTGIIPEQDWRDMVEDYKTAYVPRYRGPSSVFDVDVGDPEGEEWYGWEVERELTQDFVDKVRSGQVDSAQANGVQDFIWISVIDNRTDECCQWRSGLSTSEIRAQLQGDHKDDDCDAEVPPAHMNCRCTLAPMIQDMPEETPPDYGEFDQWLNSA